MEGKSLLLLSIIYISIKSSNSACSNDLSNLRKEHEGTVIRYTTHLLKTGQSKDAIKEITKLKNYSQHFEKIVSTLYNRNVSNTHLVASGLKLAPACLDMEIGVASLFNEMSHNGHLDNPEILIIPWIVSWCKESSKIKKVLKAIEPHKRKVVASWAENIQSANFTGILNFAKSSKPACQGMRGAIPEVIQTLLKSQSTSKQGLFPTVLILVQFIEELPFLQDMGIAYISALNVLKNLSFSHSEETLYISAKSQNKYHTNKGAISRSVTLRSLWADIYEDTPIQIRNIIWNPENCTVKNLYWDEYLYTTDEGVGYSIRRLGGNGQAFTWLPGSRRLESHFRLYRWWEENRYFFTIGSLDESQNLIVNGNKVIMGKSGYSEQSRWNVMPSDLWHVNKGLTIYAFKLRNGEDSDGFMLATKEHHLGLKRRTVEVGKGGSNSYWDIDCEPPEIIPWFEPGLTNHKTNGATIFRTHVETKVSELLNDKLHRNNSEYGELRAEH